MADSAVTARKKYDLFTPFVKLNFRGNWGKQVSKTYFLMLIVWKIDTQDQILTLKTVNKNFKNRQQNAVVQHHLARTGLYTADLAV